MELTDNSLLSGISGANSRLEPNSIFSLLAISLLHVENVEAGIFSRITMTSMTSKWYLRLGHFEAILVGLVVLQIFVMRYFLILPLNITKLIDDGTLLATSVSRKKRGTFPGKGANDVVQEHRLAESMFSILRRLDEDDCFLRTLCELENHSKKSLKLTKQVSNLLGILKRLGLQRIKTETEFTPNNVTILERKVIAEFEDAVLVGSGYGLQLDANDINTCEKSIQDPCATHYSLCTVQTKDLLFYVNNIMPFMS